MSINQYISPGSNTPLLDIFNVGVTANTNIVTTTNNPEATAYLTPFMQRSSVFSIYICLSAAASLVIKRTQTATNVTITETLAAEVANQPAWHSIQVSGFELINFQLSAPATILKLCVMEPVS